MFYRVVAVCVSLQDLCERHEKGVLHEHQRALHKYGVMKRQMMSATVQPKEPASVEQLESRIVQVAFRLSRDYFSFIDARPFKSFSYVRNEMRILPRIPSTVRPNSATTSPRGVYLVLY